MDRSMTRGRWKSQKAARIYIAEGLAVYGKTRLGARQSRRIQLAAGLWRRLKVVR